jgi:hypothetical protein
VAKLVLGMVFAVNPPTTGNDTFEQFKSAAEASRSRSSSIVPSPTSVTSSAASELPVFTSTLVPGVSNSSSTSAPQLEAPNTISPSALAAIIAGAVGSLMIIVALLFYLLVYRQRRHHGSGSRPPSVHHFSQIKSLSSSEGSLLVHPAIDRIGLRRSDEKPILPIARSHLSFPFSEVTPASSLYANSIKSAYFIRRMA